MRAVGLDVDQHRHLLVEPGGPVLLGELGAQRKIDVTEVGHVGDRVGDLLFGQRPVRPVGEARGFVDLVAGNAVDELIIAHLVAVAADHGGDLGVEDRMRDGAGLVNEDLDVLPGGVEDFQHLLVGHQPIERRKVEPRRERINDRRLVRTGHLDQAELRPEGALAHEFGIDRDERSLREAGTEDGERLRVGE